MKRQQIGACIAACVMLQPCAAFDAAPLSARGLHSACIEYSEDPDSELGRLCEAYVRGFIAGLTATVSSAPARAETFSERALRTRVGARAARLQFCSAQTISTETLIRQLLAYVALTNEPSVASASELLTAVVYRFQRCD